MSPDSYSKGGQAAACWYDGIASLNGPLATVITWSASNEKKSNLNYIYEPKRRKIFFERGIPSFVYRLKSAPPVPARIALNDSRGEPFQFIFPFCTHQMDCKFNLRKFIIEFLQGMRAIRGIVLPSSDRSPVRVRWLWCSSPSGTNRRRTCCNEISHRFH